MTSTSTQPPSRPSSPLSASRRFAELHETGCFVLPTVWDGLSAAVAVEAGAPAVATSSGAVAWSLGRADGEQTRFDELLDVVRRICRVVDVPVSIDLERGFGRSAADVHASVEQVAGAGAVGINLEDSHHGRLRPLEEQAERLSAAASVTTADGGRVHVNARTDVWLLGADPDEGMAETLRRAERYAAAGAASLFVPGCTDLDLLHRLAAAAPLPVNAMAGPGSPNVQQFAASGVRRVSLGTALAEDVYGRLRDVLVPAIQAGDFATMRVGLDYAATNTLLSVHALHPDQPAAG